MEKTTQRGTSLVLFAKYNSNDQVKEDEMDRACGEGGREGECIQGFGIIAGWKRPYEDLYVGGKIILNWMLEE
jgi:hypothetical protein